MNPGNWVFSVMMYTVSVYPADYEVYMKRISFCTMLLLISVQIIK